MKSTLSILVFTFGTLFAVTAAYADHTVTFADGRTICVHTNSSGQGTHWSEGACQGRIDPDDPGAALRNRVSPEQDSTAGRIYIEDEQRRLRSIQRDVEEDAEDDAEDDAEEDGEDDADREPARRR
jgi:hypothetical protein